MSSILRLVSVHVSEVDMIYALRYRLAYRFLDWGLRLIPNPTIRFQFEMAVKLAAETSEFILDQEEKAYAEAEDDRVFTSGS